MSRRLLLRGLPLMAGFVLAGLLMSRYLNTAWIDAHVRGQAWGGLAYVAVGALFIGAGLSRQFVSFLGGYAFGFMPGALFALLASALGCVLAFGFGRLAGRRLLRPRLAGRIRRVDRFIHDNPFSMTLLIRLLPVGWNLMVNLAAGVSSVRPAPFVLGSVIGYIPQTAVFALLGSGMTLQPVLRTTLSIVLFISSGALGIHLYRRYHRGRTLDESLDREMGA
ncbi:MAG TPA: VTT domain-containing protein [Thiohalobacter sp.]|nr:VTT domain-containing protein [Thiohalobacter sp.]